MVKVLVEQKHPCHGCRWLQLDCELFEQLELMDYENRAKETYDEFEEELKNFKGELK